MDTEKNIIFGTGFFRVCCLLTLVAISSCTSETDENSNNSQVIPAPKAIQLTTESYRKLIEDSPKEFVVINFYATWCKPCKEELPSLVEMNKGGEGKMKLVLISIDNETDVEKKLPKFLGAAGVNFENYAYSGESNKFITRFYPGWSGSIPTTLIYRKSGEMLEAITGMTTGKEIKMLINRHTKLEDN